MITNYEIDKLSGKISYSIIDGKIIKTIKRYSLSTGEEITPSIYEADKNVLLSEKEHIENRLIEIELELTDIENLELQI